MKITAKYIGCSVLLTALGLGVEARAELTPADSLVHVAFQTKAAEDVIDAVTQIDIENLMKKNFTETALDGSLSTMGGLSWGLSSLVLVDGMPRDSWDIRPSEIQSISFLKGAAAVALYGSQGANGVTLITTKRGLDQPMTIDFRATTGFEVPKHYAKYLDAASYMTLYNEACRNDGIAERYDAATIYNTAAGTNPYRYPDQKYYNDEYLRKFSNWYGFDGEIRGGNERTHYYLNIGLNHSNGLVKVGDHKNDNTLRFNVRGNVDMTITDWLSAYTNASMVVNDNYAARGDIWSMANSTWPNRFAVLLPVSMVDPNNADLQEMIGSATLINGQYLLGGTSSNSGNAIADSYEAGYVKSKTRSFTFDVGLNFDLRSILEGLTFKTSYGIDYRSFYSEGFSEGYAVYEPTWANVNGKDMIVGLNKHGNDTNSTNEFVGESTYYQLMQFRAQFDYKKVFAENHNFNAMLMGWGFQRTNSAIRKVEEWYVGDGWYADGPSFAFDYYSSYVFHPMYLETLGAMIDADRHSRIHYPRYYDRALKRTQKYAIVLERLISPEGTFPVLGRSIPYRMATMQPLALMAWYEKLPAGLTNGQVRAALTAVMHRMFDDQENFNEGGYLTIGFVGRQPNIADWYTNNGSLYMTSLSFLPLGLPAAHPFWTDAPQPRTSQKAWGGKPFPKDHHWDPGQPIRDLY